MSVFLFFLSSFLPSFISSFVSPFFPVSSFFPFLIIPYFSLSFPPPLSLCFCLACIILHLYSLRVLLQWLRGKRYRSDSWVRKMTWRKKCQPTPVFLPGQFQGEGSLLDGLHSVGLQRVRATEQLSASVLAGLSGTQFELGRRLKKKKSSKQKATELVTVLFFKSFPVPHLLSTFCCCCC